MALGQCRASIAGGAWLSHSTQCHPTSLASVSTVLPVITWAPSALSHPSASIARGRVTKSMTAYCLWPLIARKANGVALWLTPLGVHVVPVGTGLLPLTSLRWRLLLLARSLQAGIHRYRLCVSCQTLESVAVEPMVDELVVDAPLDEWEGGMSHSAAANLASTSVLR